MPLPHAQEQVETSGGELVGSVEGESSGGVNPLVSVVLEDDGSVSVESGSEVELVKEEQL